MFSGKKAKVLSKRFTKFDASSRQLYNWKQSHPKTTVAKAEQGYAVPSLTATLTVGRSGPLLLQDLNFQEHLASFAMERIPERVVHAKGAGAFGYLIITNDTMRQYSRAKLFNRIGKKTRVAVRFSTDEGSMGSPDSVQGMRGMALKFYTEDGNLDLVGSSIPVFKIRDPMLFPSVNRSHKKNPATHLFDQNMVWDFVSSRPEMTMFKFLSFTEFGYPPNYRCMDGHMIHTFKLTGGTNTTTEPIYGRFHFLPNTNQKKSSPAEYEKQAGRDVDYFTRDLYNAIETGNYPTWNLVVQTLTMDQIQRLNYNIFDPTKLVPIKDFPLAVIGKLVLNRNPTDYFNEVEQLAFNPGNLVPGIELGYDRLIQARVFAYSTAQGYRLGKNFHQLPINRPLDGVKNTYTRDGLANIDGNGDGGPNYYPNSFNGPNVSHYNQPSVYYQNGGKVGRYDNGNEGNFDQLKTYWKDMTSDDEGYIFADRVLKPLAASLCLASPEIQNRSLTNNWDPVGPEFSKLLRRQLSIANANLLRKTKDKNKKGKTAKSRIA